MQIAILVLEIFKFEKCVKYANDMTDDVIHSAQFYGKYINRAILVNLQRRPLKLGRLIVLQETYLLNCIDSFKRSIHVYSDLFFYVSTAERARPCQKHVLVTEEVGVLRTCYFGHNHPLSVKVSTMLFHS